jgi:glycosyltransferase involved in cell wall biosynthesis
MTRDDRAERGRWRTRTPATANTRALDVLILGPVPPPTGGISAHVQRLQRLLAARGFRAGVLNHFGRSGRLHSSEGVLGDLNRNPLRYLLSLRRYPSKVVHYHNSGWPFLLAVALAVHWDGRRSVVTLHGDGILSALSTRIPLVPRVTRWALRQFDEIVVVSEEVAAGLRRHLGEKRLSIIPAFLDASDAEASGLELDDEANEFLRSSRPALVASAYRIGLLPGGGDLYGLDTAVEAFCRLGSRYPDLGLVLFVACPPRGRRELKYLRGLAAQIEDANLSSRWLVRSEAPLLPAFRHDVIYVRPSRADGDAVSIREALSAGVTVVASDAVRRPAGTRIFSTSDAEALGSEVERILHERRAHPAPRRNGHTLNGRGQEAERSFENLVTVYACQPS